ncbi:hypothetical protein EON80_18505 [bacterium]|nr:MAG: hypothetical protein EON80_18505 [bacterium]
MRGVLLAIFALLPTTALAGFPFEATLDEMASSADHILVGRVTGVDMINESGRQIQDLEAKTGPGLKNQIRLRIAVDKVLITNSSNVPKILYIPLASHLHYTFGQIRDAHAQDSEPRLIFLKGPRFEAIKPGLFMRPLEQKEEALRLHKASHQDLRSNNSFKPNPHQGGA